MENFGSWSVLTTNFLFTLYIALGCVTFCSLLHLCNGKWRFQIREIAVSLSVLFPIAFVLLLILLANGEATFPWLASAHDGEHHLSGWHNYDFLVARQIIGFLIVAGLYGLFIKYQYQSSIDDSYAAQRRFRNVALLIPFAYFLYGTMVAWDFEMTLLPGWHSASYGVYHFQSNFHMFLAVFYLLLYFLGRSGKLTKPFEHKIYNYMAQFLLAMTILWTYFYFTQYLIIWYGRIPLEMDRYIAMMYDGFPALWWTFLILKFIIPFFALCLKPGRHNPQVIALVALSIIIGTWIERYVWIAGTANPADVHTPMSSMFDIVVTVVVFAVCWFAVKWSMTRYNIIKSS